MVPACHDDWVPGVATVTDLLRTVSEFEVGDIGLAAEPAAAAAAQRSLAESGLLLLGEVHGVRENPLLIRSIMKSFSLSSLALEWPEDLGPVIDAFIAAGALTEHCKLWAGDGRITAGHLAVLAERAAAGPLELVCFDGLTGAGWSWSERDEAMADRILAAHTCRGGMLVVASNAHTQTTPTRLGVSLGAVLARRRPGVREIRISYGGGSYYNSAPRAFPPSEPRSAQILLNEQDGALVLDLPMANEALVPHRAGRSPVRRG